MGCRKLATAKGRMEILSRRESQWRALVGCEAQPVVHQPGLVEQPRSIPHPFQEQNPLSHDPAAWQDDLHQWATAHCVFRDRTWGGVAALHGDYVEWSHATGNIPPATLATFQAWIAWQGFILTGPLVNGLVLVEDSKLVNH